MATPDHKCIEKDMLAKYLGRTIATLRTDAKLAQDELAWRSNVHRAYLGHIERGEKSITVAMLFKIGHGLGLPASEILKRLEAKLPQHGSDPKQA